jgi:integrase
MGRPGWFIGEHRNRLRLTSHELPPRPGEPESNEKVVRALILNTPPGPSTIGSAIAEACMIFDEVIDGTWRWPNDPRQPLQPDPKEALRPETIEKLTNLLCGQLLGERLGESTWERTWLPYLNKLKEKAKEQNWTSDEGLLREFLRQWGSNTRARQMAHDKARHLWKLAQRPWPEGIATMRGNGKAKANPKGVSAFNNQQIEALREAIKASKLTEADLVAWDCLICFGLRPKELQGLELRQENESLVAEVNWCKRSSKDDGETRIVTAVPPAGWPLDCHDLLKRWKKHAMPEGLMKMRSPGELLSRQLRRLHMPSELTAYGLRHAFALRLGIELSLDLRSAADLMGHTPQTHLAEYGKKRDQPALHSRVAALVRKRSAS